jgi:hypothetical protein
MKFIERVLNDMFSSRDYWDSNGFTAMVIDDDKIVSVSVKKSHHNYTEQILNDLQKKCNYPYITKGCGIDSVFIKCPSTKLQEVLIGIEEICKTL